MLILNSRFPVRSLQQQSNWTSERIAPGWIPIDIDGLRPVVRWMNVGKTSLSAPTFEGSVAILRRDNRPELETGHSLLASGTMHLPEVEPAGIIFHMTRCGSTLLAS